MGTLLGATLFLFLIVVLNTFSVLTASGFSSSARF
ncbi:hypothetical protein LINPERPRIM_LOCUS135 [Linum perenne]